MVIKYKNCMYSRDELSQFPLQKLASIYPQNIEEEELLQEIFEMRASVSSYFALTSLVDVKHKWQEDILQKYIDEKRETMAPENPVSLTPEDEAKLDSAVVTKETELELQAKLDKHNHKKPIKGSPENPMSREEAVDLMGEDKVKEIEETAEVVTEEELDKAIETLTEEEKPKEEAPKVEKEKKPRKPRTPKAK